MNKFLCQHPQSSWLGCSYQFKEIHKSFCGVSRIWHFTIGTLHWDWVVWNVTVVCMFSCTRIKHRHQLPISQHVLCHICKLQMPRIWLYQLEKSFGRGEGGNGPCFYNSISLCRMDTLPFKPIMNLIHIANWLSPVLFFPQLLYRATHVANPVIIWEKFPCCYFQEAQRHFWTARCILYITKIQPSL